MSEARRLLRIIQENSVVVYHGSPGPIVGDFRSRNASTNDWGLLGQLETNRVGIFFAVNVEDAAQYGKFISKYQLDLGDLADLDQSTVIRDFSSSFDPFDEENGGREKWLAVH